MGEILNAVVTTLGWMGMLLLWLLLKAQGPSASIMLKRYVFFNLLAWSLLISIQTLFYLDLDLQALGKHLPWLSIIVHDQTTQIAFRGLLALAICNFIRDILQPQKLFTVPVAEAQIQMDTFGIITSWDDDATKLFGWSSSEMVGQVLADHLIPERYRSFHQEGLARFRESGEAPILNKRLTFPALAKVNSGETVEKVVDVRIKENLTPQGTIFTAIVSPSVVLK